ncbi:hypothetical protein P3T37_005675 [Kitasatospora sp. MAA4]|uniref:M23 family metallopeptidase n=1 Tax=Kitasatospora sp. MAA4 TaxID=3035093 RepID=UPI002476D534|nr:M23 family metallopeptidase [Kitasatospora sp. MAA4]MDH6136255.1 hypothetical protein [Kitasatospora sp. MAA4]
MNQTDTEQERLREFLTAPQLDRSIFAPGFAERIGAEHLEAIRDQVRQEFGEVRSVTPDGPAGKYRVNCAQGALPASVNIDPQGRIVLLWLGIAHPGQARSVRQRLLVPLLALVVPVLAAPALAVNAAMTGTRTDALQSLLASLALVPASWLRAPWAWISQYSRTAMALITLVLLGVAAVRLPGLPTGHASFWSLALTAAAVLSAVAMTISSREARSSRSPLLISNPLPDRRVLVFQGGGPSINHHTRSPTQRFALDLICLDRYGARARGPVPRNSDAYHAYGATVTAPCDGTVIACVDGYEDQPVLASPLEPGPLHAQPTVGNHIALQVPRATAGADGESTIVILAHLQKNSIRVQQGETVTVGQPLALVGNSGNTTEPHLHIHAEVRTSDTVAPVPLRLASRPTRALLRGERLDR